MSTMTLPTEQPDLASSTDEYADRFAGAVGEYFLEVQWGIVRNMLPQASECRILDIGGGHAQITPPLIEAGYDVTVLGSEGTSTAQLDRIAGAENYKFVVGNLLALPVDDKHFDVVIGLRLLPHLQDWPRFIAECCRVASHTVIVDFPELHSVNWFSESLFSLKDRVESNTRRYQCFRKQQIAEVFASHGFKSTESVGQFAFPMALHRLLRMERVSRFVESLAMSTGLSGLFGSPVILKATHR